MKLISELIKKGMEIEEAIECHRMWLVRELGAGAGSGEQGKRERGVGIAVRNPKIDYFHQK